VILSNGAAVVELLAPVLGTAVVVVILLARVGTAVPRLGAIVVPLTNGAAVAVVVFATGAAGVVLLVPAKGAVVGTLLLALVGTAVMGAMVLSLLTGETVVAAGVAKEVGVNVALGVWLAGTSVNACVAKVEGSTVPAMGCVPRAVGTTVPKGVVVPTMGGAVLLPKIGATVEAD